eukprot:6418187-Karenia_brevis.AAC.1
MRGAPSYPGQVQVTARGFRMANRQWNTVFINRVCSRMSWGIRHANRGDRGYRAFLGNPKAASCGYR